jgi:DNA-binding transcriptional ArsR family regulator
MTTTVTHRNSTTATADRRRRDKGLAPVAFEASMLLKVLGHEGRLTVLSHLRDGGRTVGELQKLVGAPQPVVSSHLARLRHEGLVSYERVGRRTTYFLTDAKARQVLDAIDAAFCNGLRDHL